MKMKRERAVLMATAFLLVILLAGCEDPFGNKDDDDDKGTAPEIHQVNMYQYNEDTDTFTATFSFAIGETAYIEVYASDPDLDMVTMTGKTTHDATGNSDTRTLDMSEQTDPDMAYYTYSDIIGPAGAWTVEFRITDTQGNNSAWYSRSVTVTE
jgi:hypothetical protein